MKALHQPLRRALHSYWAFERLRIAERALDEALDAMPEPSFVLRSDGSIEHANPAAEALIAAHSIVAVLGRRVVRMAQLEAGALEPLWREAAAGQALEVGLWFADAGRVRTALMHLARLPREGACELRWPVASVLMVIQDDDPERARAGRLQAITERCALTRAQAGVFGLLARGVTLDEIAALQRVRISTVRTHVRHLLEKTQTRRMIELLGLLVD
ncbi:MAG: PAS domain-containing protein [Burkholderiales bacterium]|nr:PAS domain-containing protein [Burkholderiales bacterium]